jgi:C-terminal processing protease CtpA/Prc
MCLIGVAMVFSLSACLAAADEPPAGQPASRPASQPAMTAQRRAELTAWIGQLGDPAYEVREKATEALKQASDALDLLVETYRGTQDAEVVDRIEQIARRLFQDDAANLPRPGFLGIVPQPVSLAEAPGIPQGCMGIKVAGLVEEAPARKAGLEVGDIIVRFAGDTLPADAGIDEFTERIIRKGENARVDVELLREGKPMKAAVTLANREDFAPPVRNQEQAEKRFRVWWEETFTRAAP